LNNTTKEAKKRAASKPNGQRPPVTKAQLYERRCEAQDKLPNLRDVCLTPEQVDPELADKPFEFAAKYGFVNLHTKEQVESDKDKTAFSQWIGAMKKLRVPLKELLNIRPFSQCNITSWIKRANDPSKYAVRYAEMEEMLNLIKQAAASVASHIEWLPTQKPE
jgi:hypothetical protein